MNPRRGELWWVRLDPTEGSEIRKTRPCLVLTADSLNRLRRTVVVVPYSTSAQAHPPLTICVTCLGQPAVAVIDQVRAISKDRLVDSIELVPEADVSAVLAALGEILEMP